MPLSEGRDPDRGVEKLSQDSSLNDGDADSDERQPMLEVPPTPTFPPPPDISFQRPSLGRGAPGRAFSRDDPAASVEPESGTQETGAGSHLGSGLVIGITFPTCVVVGASIGIWFDHRYNPGGTAWGTIVMSLAGIAAGFLNVFRVVKQMDRRSKKR
jgi:F0F1-type ATP synthase assembly protein I